MEASPLKRDFSLIGWLYNVYALCWVALILLLIFPFALVSVLLNGVRGGNLFYSVCGFFARVWLFVTGMRYQEAYRGDASTDSRPCIYVANHRSYLDVVMMLACMHRSYRPLGKEEMAAIPLFGFFYRRFIITVDRKSLASRSKGYMALKQALNRELSVFVFPEGSFNESTDPLKYFYNGPFKLALKAGVNVRPVLFLDNLDRMHYSGVGTMRPGKCRVLFLEEVPVGSYHGGEDDRLKEEVFQRMRAALITYKGVSGAAINNDALVQ